MTYEVVKFPSYPDQSVFISVFRDVEKLVLDTVKSRLISADRDYDYCFLNCNYIVSREHLLSAIYKAIVNYSSDNYKAKTLNTEIIFNMSPINNIMDSLKRFGVDSSKDHDHLVCIKVLDEKSSPDFESLNDQLVRLLHCQKQQNIPLTDEFLQHAVDIAKLKKIYKLSDTNLTADDQDQLTRLVIGACLLRGN